jgi:hypothetical protein
MGLPRRVGRQPPLVPMPSARVRNESTSAPHVYEVAVHFPSGKSSRIAVSRAKFTAKLLSGGAAISTTRDRIAHPGGTDSPIFAAKLRWAAGTNDKAHR